MAMGSMGLSNAGSNFVNAYTMRQDRARQNAQLEKQNKIQGLMGQMITGQAQPEQMTELAQLDPSNFIAARNYLSEQETSKNQALAGQEKEKDIAEINRLLVLDDTGVQDYIGTLKDSGEMSEDDASFMLTLSPEQRRSFIEMKAGELGVEVSSGTEFQQGTGDMSGYAFNPETGLYKSDPSIVAQLEADAAEKAKLDGFLTGKDLAGVNDKITTLTSDVVDIVNAAESLEALEGRGSPAAQIAAVFKFMKANDPTSTVRESEQGMVYSAEGPMKAFSAKLNQMMGRGGLSDDNFRDLVNTAKAVANSATDSTRSNVNSYLTVLEDNLSVKAFNDMLARVPGPLEIKEINRVESTASAAPDAMAEVDSILNELGIN